MLKWYLLGVKQLLSHAQIVFLKFMHIKFSDEHPLSTLLHDGFPQIFKSDTIVSTVTTRHEPDIRACLSRLVTYLRGATFPSMLKTPSVTINFMRVPSASFSFSSRSGKEFKTI